MDLKIGLIERLALQLGVVTLLDHKHAGERQRRILTSHSQGSIYKSGTIYGGCRLQPLCESSTRNRLFS
jgi:hypothetical protein